MSNQLLMWGQKTRQGAHVNQPWTKIGDKYWSTLNFADIVTAKNVSIPNTKTKNSATIIANGDFSISDGWVLSDATISGGELVCNTAVANRLLAFRNSVGGFTAKEYWFKITESITSYTSGSVRTTISGTPAIETTLKTAIGTYTEYYKSIPSIIGADLIRPFVKASPTGFVGNFDNLVINIVGYEELYDMYVGLKAQGYTEANAILACGAYRYPNDDELLKNNFGVVYNQFAARKIQLDINTYNSENIKIKGYRLPNRSNLTELSAIGGNAAKQAGTTVWNSANGTNSSKLKLSGNGYFNSSGDYADNKESVLLLNTDTAFARNIIDNDDSFAEIAITSEGGSIRVLKETKHIAEGDSITWQDGQVYGQGADIGTIAIGYQTHMDISRILYKVNRGLSGRAMTGLIDSNYTSIVGCDYADTDLVTIAVGTNDFKLNKPIGLITDADGNTFYGAYRLSIQRMKSTGAKRIVLFTPLQRNNSGYTTTSTNTAGHKLIDYCDAIKAIAAIEGLQVIDLYNTSGITEANLATYTMDGLHPNNAGYVLIANAILAEI
jgi:lysophospholipase L1-like esterase